MIKSNRGQAIVEYTLVCVLVVVVFVFGEPDLIDSLIEAIKGRITDFGRRLGAP